MTAQAAKRLRDAEAFRLRGPKGGSRPTTATPPNVDWKDPDAVWAFKRYVFSRMQIEVRPGELVAYEPHPGQRPVHFPEPGEEHRYYVASAGQRAGKSLTAAAEVTTAMGMPGQRLWIVAPTYDLADKVFDEVHKHLVRDAIYGVGSVKRATGGGAKKGSQRIEMRWGSWVETKSAENMDSLVGERLTGLVLDEAAQLPEEVWTKYLELRLVNLKGWALIITSPRGFNWVWKYWQRGEDPERRAEGWRSGKFRTVDNPYIDPDLIEEKRRTSSATDFAQEYLGEFVSHSGLVYPDYRDELFPRGHLFDPGELAIRRDMTHFRAIDVGARHPTAASWGAMARIDLDGAGERDWLLLYGEYEETGLSHQDHARQINAISPYPLEQTWISPDAKRRAHLTTNRTESPDNLSPYDIYVKEGVYAYLAADDFSAGWSMVTALLRRALERGGRQGGMLVSRDCVKHRKHFLSYVWQDQRPQTMEGSRRDAPDRPRKYQDDLDDAVRYLAAGRPYYVVPPTYDEDDDYDPRGREGFRVGSRPAEARYLRPGMSFE